MTTLTRFLLSTLLLSNTLLAEIPAESHAPDRTQTLDKYIKGFCKSVGENENVKYEKQKLVLISRYSKATTAIAAAFGVGNFGLAYFCSYAPERRRGENMGLIISLCIAGGLATCVAAYRISKHLEKEVFVILDEKGLLQSGKRVLKWHQVDSIKTESSVTKNEYGTTISKENVLIFLDLYGTKLAEVKTTDSGDGMPIDFEQFVAIVKQFMATYGKRESV